MLEKEREKGEEKEEEEEEGNRKGKNDGMRYLPWIWFNKQAIV